MMFKKWINEIKNIYWKLLTAASLIAFNQLAFADGANPFPTIDLQGGNVVAGTGSLAMTAFRYLTVILGGILIMVGIGVLFQRMREDTREKEHGNLMTTFVLVAVVETAGFGLIAIAWKAFNTQIS